MKMRRNIPNGQILVEMLQHVVDALVHNLLVQAQSLTKR
jgi:hypothetical protein